MKSLQTVISWLKNVAHKCKLGKNGNLMTKKIARDIPTGSSEHSEGSSCDINDKASVR